MIIDLDYKVTVFLYRPGSSTHSPVNLAQAISLLKTEKFDLILSEPHQQVILDPEGSLKRMDLESFYQEYHSEGIGKIH
jgi:hypothetical protein